MNQKRRLRKGCIKMKRVIFTIIVLLLVVTLAIILYIRDWEPITQKIRIGYIPFSADLPFFVASERGYFDEQGVEVEALRFGLVDCSPKTDPVLVRV
jgi:ABC-type nitrate/sulfonate/bicarbonate transport system substrate-binding protein